MTLFGRLSLGLEIHSEGLRAVAVRRQGKTTTLLGEQTLPLAPGVLAPAANRPNVAQPEAFAAAVRTVLAPLAQGETRVALALPNAAGHIFLLEQELTFKSRSHALKVLQWQLKEVLPQDPAAVSLQYQLLGQREKGGRQVLVSALQLPVLEQYEALVLQAGFQPALIDFQAMQLHSWYRPLLALEQDYLLLGLHGDQLCLLAFRGGFLNFYRVKAAGRQPERIFHEINRSLTAYRQAHADFSRLKLHLHVEGADSAAIIEAAQACFEQKLQLLPAPAAAMAAALGAAQRML